MKKIAIVRIAGEHGLIVDVKTTLKLLNLHKKNSCSVVPNTEIFVGMLKKIKDYVTWGEINEETFSELLSNRGRIRGNKKIDEAYMKENIKMTIVEFSKKFIEGEKNLKDIPGLKPFFRLSPPRKGFERKGTKKPFSIGGVLGYRREKINDLIKRMI